MATAQKKRGGNDVAERKQAEPALSPPSTLPSESVQALQGVFNFSSFSEARQAAEFVANSGLVPPGYKGKPADVLIAWQMGAEVGLKPMQALQNIAVINSRASLWGDAFLAVCMSAQGFIDCVEWTERTEEGLTAFSSRDLTDQLTGDNECLPSLARPKSAARRRRTSLRARPTSRARSTTRSSPSPTPAAR
jgi:hypothetical protein